MKIGVIGNGNVGRALAGKLASLGHDVKLGSRSLGKPEVKEWLAATKASEGTYAEAAAHGELLLNCTPGEASVAALTAAGEANLAGKVIIDVANPLDFSKGFPPSLTVSNTDSLAETIARAFPKARVVKALNTVNVSVMVDPSIVNKGEHHLFIAGDDANAKKDVEALLRTFGWKHFIDLGDLKAARGSEAWLLLWVRLMGAQGTATFNVQVVK